MPMTVIEPSRTSNSITRDVMTGRVEVLAERGSGLTRINDHGLVVGARNSQERMAITEGDPLSAETEMIFENRLEWGDFRVRVEARTRLRATRESFLLSADLDVWDGEERILTKTWNCPIPRQLV